VVSLKARPLYPPEKTPVSTLYGPVYLSITFHILILPVLLGPGVYSASNRNEYKKHKNNVSGE
jgi:hypothetical protein